MRKVFFVSGILLIILSVMLLAGLIDFRNGAEEALAEGNRKYAAGDYQQALDIYAKGLEKKEDPKLYYNAGQAAYCLKDYTQAAEYYGKAPGNVAKYLNMGNSSLRLGDASDDDNQKLQYYQQAMQTYKQGILEFPQNVELKYNYEYVKKKIGPLEQNNKNQQNSEDNSGNQDEGQDGQGQDGGNDDQQDNGENQQDQNGREHNQEGSSPQQESQGQNQTEPQDQTEQQGQAGGQDQTEGQDRQASGSNGQDSEGQEESSAVQSGLSGEELAQVLQMLEKQEEDSLKNNQEVKGNDKGEDYDW